MLESRGYCGKNGRPKTSLLTRAPGREIST